jgi:rod shape determining protein RodA
MKALILHFKKLDWVLIGAAILLVAFGLLAIYSVSSSKGSLINFEKQIIFFAIGFVLMILCSFFDWRNFRNNSNFILFLYALCILSLIFILFFAPEIRGTKTWFKIGFLSVDPVEAAKIILIILLAKYFSRRHIEMYRIQHIFLSGFYVFIPVALVFLQPNFGSALILISIWLGILILSGIKIRHFFLIVVLFIAVFAVSWGTILKDYQKDRITNFFMPKASDQLKIGWNQTQSKIAIGSGGIFGQGIGKGTQIQSGFLPEAHTDFIFATISEETGFLGVGILFSLFAILIWRIAKIAISARDNFPRLFASGLIVFLIFQSFVHIGMNMGILPIIGTPLPLVSYGGSGLIALFAAIGLLQNMKINK